MKHLPTVVLPMLIALAPAAAASPLIVFGAGTLAAPFRQVDEAFAARHPDLVVQAQFGGSVKMVKQVTELHQLADVVAVADSSVIPKYLRSVWYAGFAANAITFVYTERSRFGDEITAQNWFQVLARPGVQVGRSNPDTDPSGYQTLQMLLLAEKYYEKPGLAAAVIANAPPTNMRDTETELIAALQSGEIDYLAIYRSDARQHGFRFLDLPPQVDLSEAGYSASYARVSVQTANGALSGRPIVYGVTIPDNAPHPDAALAYLSFLLGPEGRKIMEANGFRTLAPAYANDIDKVPAALKPLLVPWP